MDRWIDQPPLVAFESWITVPTLQVGPTVSLVRSQQWRQTSARHLAATDPHSGAFVLQVGHTALGLVGAITVTAPGVLTWNDPLPPDVDVEVPLLFEIINENFSPLLDENIAAQQEAANLVFNQSDPDFAVWRTSAPVKPQTLTHARTILSYYNPRECNPV
jgi:hypothetical protein